MCDQYANPALFWFEQADDETSIHAPTFKTIQVYVLQGHLSIVLEPFMAEGI